MSPFLGQVHPFSGSAPALSPFAVAPGVAAPAVAAPRPAPTPPVARAAAAPPPMAAPRRAPGGAAQAPVGPVPHGHAVAVTRVGREAREQFYMGFAGGISFIQEAENSGTSLAFTTKPDPGYAISGTVGLAFGGGFRTEFEMAYRQADIHDMKFTGTGSLGVGTGSQKGKGTLGATAMMFNGAWDFHGAGALTHYVMGGLGIARVSLLDGKANGVSVADDSALVFAWQIGVGASAQVAERWLFDIGYRLFSTLDPELTDVTGASFDSEFTSHEVLAGLRFLF